MEERTGGGKSPWLVSIRRGEAQSKAAVPSRRRGRRECLLPPSVGCARNSPLNRLYQGIAQRGYPDRTDRERVEGARPGASETANQYSHGGGSDPRREPAHSERYEEVVEETRSRRGRIKSRKPGTTCRRSGAATDSDPFPPIKDPAPFLPGVVESWAIPFHHILSRLSSRETKPSG